MTLITPAEYEARLGFLRKENTQLLERNTELSQARERLVLDLARVSGRSDARRDTIAELRGALALSLAERRRLEEEVDALLGRLRDDRQAEPGGSSQ